MRSGPVFLVLRAMSGVASPSHAGRMFWRSPAGKALGVFAVVAALLLVSEHWAHLAGYVPLLLVLGLCIGMHFFMHRTHGSHRDDQHTGSHGRGQDD